MVLSKPRRKVICTDAFLWLAELGSIRLDAVITSIPDMSEIGMTNVDEFRRWFTTAARMVMKAVKPEGFAIFYQVDRRINGGIISKSEMLYKIAAELELKPVWHKIILRRNPDVVDLFRPGFGHFVCFSKHGRAGKAVADVFTAEPLSWKQGMPIKAIVTACLFVGRTAKTVADPFCGVGTVLAAANACGLNAVGIELDADRAKRARTYTIGE